MRYLVGFGLALALVAFPTRVNAHKEEGASKQASAASFAHRAGLLQPQLMLRASYYLYLDAGADAGGEDATSASNAEEPVSSPAPGTEAPDIDSLSQKAIDHYEIRRVQSGNQGRTEGRSRGKKAGIAVGVVLGVGLVGLAIGAGVAMSNWEM